MKRALPVVLPIALSCLVLSACASSSKFGPIERQNPFPSRVEVTKLTAQPAPSGVFEEKEVIIVDRWSLQGPLPPTLGTYPRTPQDRWERLVGEASAEADGAVASEAMRCVARESGLFYAEHGTYPSESLQHFIESRCGAVASQVQLLVWTWTGGDEQRRFTNGEEAIRDRLESAAESAEATELGGWYGERGDEGVAMFAVGRKSVELEPMSLRPGADGTLHLKGRVYGDYDEIVGAINRGRYGHARCETMPQPEAPRFHVVCKADPADPYASLELSASRETALFGHSMLRRRFWPAQAPASSYDRLALREHRPILEEIEAAAPPAGGEVAVTEVVASEAPPEEPEAPAIRVETKRVATDATGIRAELIAQLNAVRREAGLAPVAMAEAQSNTASSIAPHYFKASREGAGDDELNTYVFGMLAGWDVEGDVLDGNWVGDWTSSGDARQLVERLIERPFGRRVLLAEDVEQIALGHVLEGQGGTLGAVVTAYTFVPEESHEERVARFFQEFNSKRRLFGSGKARYSKKLRDEADGLSKEVAAGRMQLHEAANLMLDETSKTYRNRPVYVYMFETHDLDELTLPKELLQADPLWVSVMVTSYKAKGFPWSVYGVVLTYPKPKGSTKVADGPSIDVGAGASPAAVLAAP